MNTADTSSEAGAKIKVESENRIVLRRENTTKWYTGME